MLRKLSFRSISCGMWHVSHQTSHTATTAAEPSTSALLFVLLCYAVTVLPQLLYVGTHAARFPFRRFCRFSAFRFIFTHCLLCQCCGILNFTRTHLHACVYVQQYQHHSPTAESHGNCKISNLTAPYPHVQRELICSPREKRNKW